MKSGVTTSVHGKGKIYQTPEGRLLWCGVALTAILMGFLIGYAVIDPSGAGKLFLAFAAHIFGGRAAGIGLCFMAGISSVETLLYNFYIEVLIVFLSYSIFILSMSNHIKFRWVMEFCMGLKKKADHHKKRIHSCGWLGLFLFVMLPLPVTGPVTGSIIGYLLNIPRSRNFSAVLSGTFVAVFFWVIFFDFLAQHVQVIQYVIFAIIAIVILAHLKTLRRWLR